MADTPELQFATGPSQDAPPQPQQYQRPSATEALAQLKREVAELVQQHHAEAAKARPAQQARTLPSGDTAPHFDVHLAEDSSAANRWPRNTRARGN